VVYRPLPTRCEDCHAVRPQGAPRPAAMLPSTPAAAGGGMWS
jgi:hypothetical protein